MAVDQLELVVITGMSGAGKTVAMQSFEDMGYFCVDNMPPSLLPKFWELVKESGKITKIALVIDLRSRAFFDEIMSAIAGLDNTSFITTKILFLEASDDALVSRYKETRRTHPLAGEGRIYDGIIAERRLLLLCSNFSIQGRWFCVDFFLKEKKDIVFLLGNSLSLTSCGACCFTSF